MAASEARPSLLRRFGWLVLIWAASVAALGLVALILRGILTLAGLKSH